MQYRTQLEVPAEANPEVVKALQGAATTLGVKPEDVAVSATASPDSYSLTIHTFPDPEPKE